MRVVFDVCVRKSLYSKFKKFVEYANLDVEVIRVEDSIPDHLIIKKYSPDVVVTYDKSFPFKNKVILKKDKTDVSIIVKKIFGEIYAPMSTYQRRHSV